MDFLKISGIIAGLSLLAVVLAWGLGKPVLGILERILGPAYRGSLTVYHTSFVLIVLGGSFYAFLNLYYYVLVIIRQQNVIFGIYLVLTVSAAWLAPRLVSSYGIPGAAWAYVSLMAVMAVGFVAGAWMLTIRAGAGKQ